MCPGGYRTLLGACSCLTCLPLHFLQPHQPLIGTHRPSLLWGLPTTSSTHIPVQTRHPNHITHGRVWNPEFFLWEKEEEEEEQRRTSNLLKVSEPFPGLSSRL